MMPRPNGPPAGTDFRSGAGARQKLQGGIPHMAPLKEPVLVIDDDRVLCELLDAYLTREGFCCEMVHDGETGLEKLRTGPYGAVVLDVMLPGGQDGFSVLRQIRARNGTPVLMLTARGDDLDRIVGLEMGADDYLPKPFNPRELVARLRAILRRANGSQGIVAAAASVRCHIGDLEIVHEARTVLQKGKPLELTAVEFNLLERLLLRAGQVVTREELCQSVLARSLSPYDRSIDVHVSKLRKKLGKDEDGRERIKAIRNSGYIYLLPGLIHDEEAAAARTAEK